MTPPDNLWDVGLGHQTPRTSSRVSLYGNTDASIPRSFASAGPLPSLEDYLPGLSNGTITEAQADDVQELQRSFILHSEIQGVNPVINNSWEANRSEIEKLYIIEDRPLGEVVTIMAGRGFRAPGHAYKKRFAKWGLRKYKTVRNYARPINEISVPQSSTSGSLRGRRSASTSTLHEETSIQNRPSRSNGVVAQTTNFGLNAPVLIQQIDYDNRVDAILFQVKALYIGSIEQKKWQVDDHFVVHEDIHDDLLVGVGTALQSLDSSEQDVAERMMMKAFLTLENVVVNCGLFSLPSIWESYLRMVRKGQPQLATMFLRHALSLSLCKAGHKSHHPFAQVIKILLEVEKIDANMLEHVIICAYRSCVDHINGKLKLEHLTALQLWSDFVVYVDNSSAGETKKAVDHFRSLILRSEKVNGVDDDLTLEILGLSLYVLQSSDSTAAEAELVALDMFCRVNRRLQNGEKLDGTLLILWKDLKHALGNFCYARGDINAAISHLEGCLIHGVVDNRDFIPLKSLEKWYIELGKPDEAEKIHHLRIGSSKRIAGDEVELGQNEEVENHGEGGKEDGDDREENDDGNVEE